MEHDEIAQLQALLLGEQTKSDYLLNQVSQPLTSLAGRSMILPASAGLDANPSAPYLPRTKPLPVSVICRRSTASSLLKRIWAASPSCFKAARSSRFTAST